MQKDNRIPRKSKNIIFREIEGENILIPINKGNNYNLLIFGLNDTARFIWDKINGVRSESEITEAMLKSFDVTVQAARKDVSKFLSLLEEKEIIHF